MVPYCASVRIWARRRGGVASIQPLWKTAVGLVATGLSSGADLLIVNKFGKHEAEGRGFRDVIAEAVAMDIPVLVGINALNRSAFESFCGRVGNPAAA